MLQNSEIEINTNNEKIEASQPPTFKVPITEKLNNLNSHIKCNYF